MLRFMCWKVNFNIESLFMSVLNGNEQSNAALQIIPPVKSGHGQGEVPNKVGFAVILS